MIARLRGRLQRIVSTETHRDLIVTITREGIELRGASTSRRLFTPWADVVRATDLPGDAPAKFLGDKLGWLTTK